LFAALGGTPDGGGVWTPTLAGAGVYTYTVTATAPCTGTDAATVTVSQQDLPDAGENGLLTICEGSTLTEGQLFAALGGTPDGGGVWTPTLAGAGVYTYTVTATAPCTGTDAATVTVSQQDLPDAGENGLLTICEGSTLTEGQLFAALGGTPDGGGVWTPTLAGAGVYTYTVTATAPCTGTDAATVTVSQQDLPDAGENGLLTICEGSTLTEGQLFAALGGTPDGGGVWTPTLAGAGVYTYTVTATAPCTGTDAATVTVSQQDLPDAGENGLLTICEGSTLTEGQLFAALGGTPDGGGVWTPTLAGAGVYTYTVTATAPCTGTDAATVTVSQQDLPDAGENGLLTICEGSTLTEGQLFAALGGTPDGGGVWTPTLAGAGVYTYTVTATAPCTGTDAATVTVTEQNCNDCPDQLAIYTVEVNPTVPVAIGTWVQLNASFTNNYPVDVTVDWGDGNSTLFDDKTDGIVNTNHVYSDAGVYSITIKLKDVCENTISTVYEYVVVYDPSGGFVTGGGWINSPAGAYVANPLLTGKANFGFVAKYQKGKTVPTGHTEFQFHAAGMNFKSTDYEWLVIAGKKAQFKGSGTINGSGNYGFILTATDDIPDRFRIKIWNIATGKIVYDNQIGSPDNANPSTAIAGGSIVIHNSKTKSVEISEINSVAEMLNITVYPNPFNDRLRFDFVSPADVNARIDLFDMNGRLVKTIFEQQVEADQYYEAEFKPETIISAFYVYRITLGDNVQNGKVIFKKE
jgi:hypothetical protein